MDRIDKLITSFYPVGSQGFKDAMVTLLGNDASWETLRSPFTQYTSNLLTLAINDKYVGLLQTPPVDADELVPVGYDSFGISAYGRLIFSMAEYVARLGPDELFDGNDREWVMRHLMLTSIECQHGLDVPRCSQIWNCDNPGSTPIVLEFIQRANYIFNCRFETVLVSEPGHNWYTLLYSAIKNHNDKINNFFGFVASVMCPNHQDVDETTRIDVMSGALVETILTKLVAQIGLKSDALPLWLGLVKAEAPERRWFYF